VILMNSYFSGHMVDLNLESFILVSGLDIKAEHRYSVTAGIFT
jgi:hypothetical protein